MEEPNERKIFQEYNLGKHIFYFTSFYFIFLKNSYIVDKYGTTIWIWVGKNASKKERIEAIRNAHGFIKKKNYPSHIPVSRVVEGGEPTEFKCLFVSWQNHDHNNTFNNIHTGNYITVIFHLILKNV